MRVVNVAEILLVNLVILIVTIQAQISIGRDFGISIPVLTSVERTYCDEESGCSGSQDCRMVFPCLHYCGPRKQCVEQQQIQRGADETCKAQGFREAVLLDNWSHPLLPLPCKDVSQKEHQCPVGSECVDDGQSGSICCIRADDRCGGCPEGQGCYDRPPKCIPGQPCNTALVPMCVPHQCAYCRPNEDCVRKTRNGFPCLNPDRGCQYLYKCMEKGLCGSGSCPPGQWCTYTGTICADPRPNVSVNDWSRYGCFKQYECKGVDHCGGCPDGYECVHTGNLCVTEPCTVYECKKKDNCSGQCRFNQECKAFYPDCPSYAPRCNPTYQCVDLPGYGTCKVVEFHPGC